MWRRLGQVVAVCLFSLSIFDMRRTSAASEIRVAATVTPVHSLVAMVMEGVTDPALIVRPGASPHSYALKPSEARALDEAELVFWVGEALEPWMAKAVTTLAADAVVIELGAAPGLTRHRLREGGVFGDHDHEAHHDHGEAGIDFHLWLDPDNALIWLEVIADNLAKADSDNADDYRANAQRAAGQLRTMSVEIEQRVGPIKEKPYVVFHDAYQYFERRFGLHPLGAVSLGDADRPGPARIVELRDAIAKSGAVCIFAEPQFEPRLVKTVIEGTDVKSGMLDPIGAGLQPGAELYPLLVRGLAANLLDCLG